MSLFAKFMLRRGWIQLSRYGLEMSETGQLRGLASLALQEPTELPSYDFAAPAALSIADAQREMTRSPKLPVAPLLTPVATGDDDRAWQAAMARAKAKTSCELGVADTLNVPSDAFSLKPAVKQAAPPVPVVAAVAPAVKAPVAAPAPVVTATPPVVEADEEQDWAALMAAANARAQQEQPRQPAAAAQPASASLPDFVPAPFVPAPMASAQVEQTATPANDDMPAAMVTSIHHRRLALPSVAVGIASPASEEDDWAKLRADVEAREQAERQRKQRAMREIQRLQNNSVRPGAGAPPIPRRRIAAGTKNIPRALSPSPAAFAPVAEAEITQVADDVTDFTHIGDSTQVAAYQHADTNGVGDSTQVELPRISQRFA